MADLGTVVSADASELPAILLQMESSARHLDRLMPIVSEILVAAVDDVYKAEGPGWEPFSPNTHRSRGDMGSAKLLQNLGTMADSTMGENGSDWAEARSYVPYAKYHASGNAKLPQRNPFDLGPFEAGVLEEVAKLLQDTGAMAGSTMGENGSDWAEARAFVPYAKYHASGNAKLPQRNPFDLGPFEAGVLEEVAKLCLDEVVK